MLYHSSKTLAEAERRCGGEEEIEGINDIVKKLVVETYSDNMESI